ncbi:CARDB domain-containing protein [Halosolutus amylolyticus]|uniref:CARDB domain-containing protein n=1 Tax=Halosolutus amylolyticus TaxID=2932267 RepID=A0ABD5PMY1_9EURY|nr:CARDB domain-containing protein [Halosolutus amylolyticus]
MTQRIITAITTLAVVAALVVSATVGAGSVTANTAPPIDDEYAVVQGDECIPIEPLGFGHQTTEEYYDYRTPENVTETIRSGTTYSSHGTTQFQEDDTSILFLHESADGLSLVMVHDQYDGSSDGGAATFQISNLPEEGEWVVEDDNYSDGETEWDHRETSSRISWAWSANRTDGAAFNGGLDDEFDIEIYPSFNEQATLSGVYDGEVSDWEVISGPEHDTERHSLNMDRPIRITSESCSSYTVTDLDYDDTVAPGETTEVEATIQNEGSSNETYPVRFTLDGETVAEKEISLEAGESTTVSTSLELDERGTYTIGVVDESAEITVGDEGGGDDDELPGFGVTAAALAAILAALVARYRS